MLASAMFESKASTIHKSSNVMIRRTVESTSIRENADAASKPVMDANGAAYARMSPEAEAPTHAGHVTANPRSGPGRAVAALRLAAKRRRARAITRPESNERVAAAAIEYG